MTEKRFELKSYHFKEMKLFVYDHLEDKELILSIYDLVNLLNEMSKQEYEFLMAKKEIKEKIRKLGESLDD